MSFLDKLKQIFFGKKRIEPASYEVTTYDTSSVHIPKYGTLSKEDKEQVDRYMSQTRITNIEDIVTYGGELSNYSTGILDLLLNAYYNITDKNVGTNLSQEDMLRLRLDGLIANERLLVFGNMLQDLESETRLRTVALEEIFKERKKSFGVKSIFDKAERIHRHNMGNQFEYAIQRMKIAKKTVDGQIQLAMNTYNTNRNVKKCY